jgi:DcuC family C4-dicarboxylate transporter
MMTRRLPALLALPGMGLTIALLVGLQAGLSGAELRHLLLDEVVEKGSLEMARAIVVACAGGALARLILQQGVSQAMVALAAEYAGDRKGLLAVCMLAVVALNFTALTGVGAILLLGSLVLPVLLAAGFSSRFAGVLMLLGIAIGGLVNPLALQIYQDVLQVELADCRSFSLTYACLLALVAGFYLWRQLRLEGKRFAWAAEPAARPNQIPTRALLTPVLPIFLILCPGLQLTPLAAILVALLYGSLVLQPARWLHTLSEAVIEGIREVAPVIALFIGLGMAIVALTNDLSRNALAPMVQFGLPTSAVAYVLYFTLLAPLATYRGPLTLYGLGGGVAALMAHSGVLPVPAILAAFLCLGQVQSVCDPTCTHAVCVGQILGESPERLALHALPYVWGFLAVALTYAVLVQGVLGN